MTSIHRKLPSRTSSRLATSRWSSQCSMQTWSKCYTWLSTLFSLHVSQIFNGKQSKLFLSTSAIHSMMRVTQMNNPTLTSQWGFVLIILSYQRAYTLFKKLFWKCLLTSLQISLLLSTRSDLWPSCILILAPMALNKSKGSWNTLLLFRTPRGWWFYDTIGIPHSEVIMLIPSALSFSLVWPSYYKPFSVLAMSLKHYANHLAL